MAIILFLIVHIWAVNDFTIGIDEINQSKFFPTLQMGVTGEMNNTVSFNTEPKSARNAMLMSALLPGTGQLYIGKTTRAGVFLAADAASFFALYRFNKEKNNFSDQYKMYAYSYAGLRKGVGDNIYRLAQRYRNYEEYNRVVELYARNFLLANRISKEEYDDYVNRNKIKPEDAWDWQNDFYLNQYRELRQEKQNYEIYENFALGALFINRIISVIDAAIQTQKVNRNSHVYVIPEDNGRGISLIYEYKF